MDKVELKPCPFCGSNNIGFSSKTMGHEWNLAIGEYSRRHVAMYCKDCNTYGSRVIVNGMSYNGSAQEGKSAAITAWNTRYEQPNEPLTIEELKQMEGFPVWVDNKFNNVQFYALHEDVETEYDCIELKPSHSLNTHNYSISGYGKTWLAYRSKPERTEK